MANTIGWGQGTINNTNGWGKGASNNSISWGSIYGNSPSGETNIIGGLQPTFELKYDLISTDFTFTRNSFATRVNEFGLIETVTNLGSDLVRNGSFDELGSELVTNGDFENGATDWTLGNGWSISGEKAECIGAASHSNLSQSIPFLSGVTYKITFDIVVDSGNFTIRLSGSGNDSGALISSSQTQYTEYITTTANRSSFNIRSNDGNGVGSIDNVSIKQVDPNDDWLLGEGWSIANGVASCDGTQATTSYCIQALTITIGKTYKISATLSNISSGSFYLQVGGNLGDVITTDGTYTQYITALSTSGLRLRAQSGFIGSIDNVSVQEVLTDDVPRIDYTGSTFDVPVLGDELVVNGDFENGDAGWTTEANWIISGGLLNGSNAVTETYRLDTSIVSGKSYLFEFDIKNYTLGTISPKLGGISGTAVSGIGTYREIIVAGSGGRKVSLDAVLPFTGSIDNVSVKEVTAYTTTDKGAFLLEPQSTNLVAYSEDFSDSYWTKTGASVTSGFTSPSGETNAFKLAENASGGAHAFYSNTLSSTNGETYTYSLFVKYNGRQWFRLWGQYGSSNFSTYFDIQNGLLGSKDSGVTSKIEDYGNGWYRVSATATSDGTANRFRGYLADADNSPIYDGDGVSGAYVYGAQLEATYATSYIPTSGTTVTRAQESCVNATVSANSEEGVLYAEISALSNDLTNRYITISDGSNSNYIRLAYNTSSNTIEARYYNGGTFQCALNASISDETDVKKVAFKWKQDDFSVWVDGVEMDSDNSGNVITPNVFDDLTFSRPDGSVFPFYGRTKDLKIYDKALTDDELTELTTI